MTLEALGTRRATFTWETSFTLWQRHQGEIRERDRVEAQGKGGRWEAEWGPGLRVAVQLGSAGRTERGESRPKETTRNGRQDTHSGTHEAGGSSFTGNTLENEKDV